MTEEQEKHLNSVIVYMAEATDEKYQKGAFEHGGLLSDMPILDLLDNAIDEAIDQCTYLITLKQKLLKESKM